MDDNQIENLVERVERAFPGDPSAQRQAWEFIEMVMTAWDAAAVESFETSEAATRADASAEASRRLMEACRSLLRETGGRLASAVQVLLPTEPGIATLGRGGRELAIGMERDAADAVNADPMISVENGSDFLTLLSRIGGTGTPGRLGAVLLTGDGTMRVERFERVDDSIAAAHFEFPPTAGPLGVVVVLFDNES